MVTSTSGASGSAAAGGLLSPPHPAAAKASAAAIATKTDRKVYFIRVGGREGRKLKGGIRSEEHPAFYTKSSGNATGIQARQRFQIAAVAVSATARFGISARRPRRVTSARRCGRLRAMIVPFGFLHETNP